MGHLGGGSEVGEGGEGEGNRFCLYFFFSKFFLEKKTIILSWNLNNSLVLICVSLDVLFNEQFEAIKIEVQ